MNEHDTQLLADLMRETLFTNQKPDLSFLDKVSDDGLKEFGTKLAEGLNQTLPPALDRPALLNAIDSLLHYCYAQDIGPQRKEHIVVDVNHRNRYGEDINGSGVNEHSYPQQWLDAPRNVTQRLLRYYRHLNGWQSVSGFMLHHNFNPRHVNLLPILIADEAERYKIAHPKAPEQETSNYIQSEYIAHIRPEERNAETVEFHKKYGGHNIAGYDLSPKAQADLLKLLQKKAIHHNGDYKHTKERPGWIDLDTMGKTHRRILNNQRRNIAQLLDDKHSKKCLEYQSEHQCSEEEARQWTDHSYMWRSQSLKGSVRRLLGPEAQQDVVNYLEQQYGPSENTQPTVQR